MTFLLSKFLPALVLPLGIVLLLLLVAFLVRKRIVIAAAATFLYASSLPITADVLAGWVEGGQRPSDAAALRAPSPAGERSSAEGLDIDDGAADDATAQRFDAIVVLSGQGPVLTRSAGVHAWNDPDRFLGGLDAYEAGLARTLVFTGGTDPLAPWLGREGDLLATYAERFGVAAEDILVTGAVTNTQEEATAVAGLLGSLPRDEGAVRIVLVTSAAHMARAATVFRRAGLDVTPYAVDFERDPIRRYDVLQWIPNAEALDVTSRMLREVMGRIVYRVPRDAWWQP